jgi:hypothetical protein
MIKQRDAVSEPVNRDGRFLGPPAMGTIWQEPPAQPPLTIMPRSHPESVPCPHCGGDIPADARFCRHCGSSDEDGWADDRWDDGDDDFDYDEFIDQHFSSSLVNRRLSPVWWWTAVTLLAVFVAYLLFAW